MTDYMIGTVEAARSLTRKMVLLYVVVKQILAIAAPNVDPELWIPRAIIGASMYGLTVVITKNRRLSSNWLATFIPIIMALPEILWVVLLGGEWLIFLYIIGCSLVGMLFLEFRGLLISMTVNCVVLTFCSLILGINMSGAGVFTMLNDFYGIVAVVIINILIYLTCKQFTYAFKQFRETGEAFSTIMETTPGFLAVINGYARIAHISRSLAEWFGISDIKYAKKRSFLDLCNKMGIMSAVQGLMEQGGTAEEMVVTRHDDKDRHFLLRSFSMGEHTVARTFEFTDVTDMMEAKMTAEEADRQKSNFLANMSHEIRTPMNAIVGMTELMLTTPLNSVQQSQALAVKNAAMSLLTIINDILDFSKISAGKMEAAATPFNTAAFINDTLNIININAAEAGLALKVAISNNVPPKIIGDEVRIKQCLLNLLNNAIKFTKAGSISLDISGEHAEGGLKLNFTVRDTGMGIKKSEINRLFEAFTQLDTKKNRDIMGTGLGLAITKRLVEMMGGQISVESVYGEGSAFSFYIICEDGQDGKTADPPNAKERCVLEYEPGKYQAENLRAALLEFLGGTAEECTPERRDDVKFNAFKTKNARVLVVDDNPVNLTVAAGMLRHYGIEVITALNGKEGLDRIQEEEFDAAFFDHMMPVMDGVEAAAAIRALGGRFETIPIIALSANAMPGVEKMFLDAGMNAYLSKPVMMKDLHRTLLNFLPPEKIIT